MNTWKLLPSMLISGGNIRKISQRCSKKYFLGQHLPQIFQWIWSAKLLLQLEGFVVNCHYAGHRCNKERDFSRFWDPYYFNCFTYRAPEQMETDDSLSEGIENGWSAILLSGSGMLDKKWGNTNVARITWMAISSVLKWRCARCDTSAQYRTIPFYRRIRRAARVFRLFWHKAKKEYKNRASSW